MLLQHKNIGNYLKKKRTLKKLTQSEVAHQLGYKSAQFISNWERGLCSPPLEAISMLIDIYGLSKTEVVEFLIEENKRVIKEGLDRHRKTKKA
ncbi:MAG: helix-turn-helix transcriptional regulator [Oligoflexia bacterium]|nr:helix-turn-helix transcriptional regulator [Oligoflexia bacterium]